MEIEIKVKIEKSNNLALFLKEKGTLRYTKNQTDYYYTPSHRSFVSVDPVIEWLRIREGEGGCSVNYKKWIHNEDGESNHCEELETVVEDVEVMKKMFEVLNFKHLVTVNKKRTAWKYKDYEISFDEVKDLGDFVEIEYIGSEKVDPKMATSGMLSFLSDLECGRVDRDFRGYPYLLMEKTGLLNA